MSISENEQAHLSSGKNDTSASNSYQNYHDEELKVIIQKGTRRFHWLYGWLLVIALGFIFSITVIVVFSVMWHYLVPAGGNGTSDWTWLEDSQLAKLQSMLFSGVLGAILPIIVKKVLDKNTSNDTLNM